MDDILMKIYDEQKELIDTRLRLFSNIAEKGDDKELFDELAFCTLTPQAKPEEAERTLVVLKNKSLLYTADAETLSQYLQRVRFRYNKARFLVHNREQCRHDGRFVLKSLLEQYPTAKEKREWLVSEMKGIGWKEASHFLRNTGLGLDLAILDRHLLRSISAKFGLEQPKTINKTTYLRWEELLKEWANILNIPFPALDFVIFYWKTGKIFK